MGGWEGEKVGGGMRIDCECGMQIAECGLDKAEEFDSGFRHPSLRGSAPDALWIL